MVTLSGMLAARGTRAVALGLVLFYSFVLTESDAHAQEGAISPPAPLQWPVQAGPTANSDFSITVLRQQVEFGGNEELCKILMREAGQPIPPNFNWSLCPPQFQAKVTAHEGKVSWAPSAEPTKCGTNCVGRPFMTQSSSLDRPNSIFAMLYGHLDFAIDVPGPFNRTVRYGYEAQFRCLTEPGAREGDFNIRLVFGTPVVGEPGILEGIVDFMIPANISRSIEAGIRRRLSAPRSQSQLLGRCTSIGAKKDPQPSFDSALFDRPPPGTMQPTVHNPPIGTVQGKSATVRFVRITRKPPVFGYAPPAEPGQFSVFVNGIAAHFPDTPALNLPAAGGSAAINFCKTIDMNGADRLQLIFVNSHSGAVWSQFGANTNFGAGPQRTMTTGRKVVVPGQPGPPNPTTGRAPVGRPQSIVLREFELVYTIEYRRPPDQVGGARPVTGDGTRTTRPGTILEPVLGQSIQPCRKI